MLVDIQNIIDEVKKVLPASLDLLVLRPGVLRQGRVLKD